MFLYNFNCITLTLMVGLFFANLLRYSIYIVVDFILIFRIVRLIEVFTSVPPAPVPAPVCWHWVFYSATAFLPANSAAPAKTSAPQPYTWRCPPT